jgi:hypothetical protein
MESGFIIGLCIAMAAFTAVSLVLGLLAYAKVVGMEKSTHRIQYMPVPSPTGEAGQQDAKSLAKSLMGDNYGDY